MGEWNGEAKGMMGVQGEPRCDGKGAPHPASPQGGPAPSLAPDRQRGMMRALSDQPETRRQAVQAAAVPGAQSTYLVHSS